MFRNYVRIENNTYVEFYPGRAYDSESVDWQPGDPSRIGLEMPIVEWQPPWIIAALVDVTDMDPQPQYGWIYDPATGLFSEPPPPYVDPRPPIIEELENIDQESLRHIRSLIVNDPTIGAGTVERSELELLEARAIVLIAELEALPDLKTA